MHNKSVKPVRIITTGDWHCGSKGGLTPPEFEIGAGNTVESKLIYEKRRKLWEWWEEETSQLAREQRFNMILINGDVIDGDGLKSGGREQLFPDRDKQCDMGVSIVERLMKKSNFLKSSSCKYNVLFTLGSSYHEGPHEDWEGQVVRVLNAKYGKDFSKIDVLFRLQVRGFPFTIKHRISASPAGMRKELDKEHWTWLRESVSFLRNFHTEQEDSENDPEFRKATRLLIGSHVHKSHSQKYHGKFQIVTLPCLQIPFSTCKLARELTNNPIDLGFGHLDIYDEWNYSYVEHIMDSISESPEVLIVE